MLSLASKTTTPPGGYRYQDEDTNQLFEAPHMAALVDVVTKHRVANDLEVPKDLPAIIEDWLCQHLPPGVCKNASGRIVKSGVYYHTAENCVRNTSVLSKTMRREKRNFVAQDVADERAAICIVCEYNSAPLGCLTCRGVKTMIDSMRHGKTTPYDEKLWVCGINGTLNHFQVFADEETILETAGKGVYPDSCWKPERTKKGARDGNASKRRTEGTAGRRYRDSRRKSKLSARRSSVALNRVRAGRVKGGCCGRSRKAKA